MKHTIYISAAKGKQGGWLHLNNIRYKDKDWVITKDHKVYLKSEEKAGDQPLTIHITTEKKFSFSYDDDAAFKNDATNEGRRLMAEIIQYHPQMVTEGFKNPNAGTALLFEFEDIAMNDNRNFRVLAMIRNAMNKVWDMTYREKMNVMYYYGQNPVGMGHKQVTIQLLDSSFGVVMRRIPYLNTGKTFIEHFVSDYKASDPTYALKTTILKGLLVNGPDGTTLLKRDGAAILFGDKVLGSNIDEAYAWFINNQEQKNYLISMVSQADTLDADDLDVAVNKMMEGDAAPETALAQKASIEELKLKGKKLLVERFWQLKPDVLIEEIAKAEVIWKDVELLGLTGDVEKMKGKTLEKIQQLVERKKSEAEYATT